MINRADRDRVKEIALDQTKESIQQQFRERERGNHSWGCETQTSDQSLRKPYIYYPPEHSVESPEVQSASIHPSLHRRLMGKLQDGFSCPGTNEMLHLITCCKQDLKVAFRRMCRRKRKLKILSYDLLEIQERNKT